MKYFSYILTLFYLLCNTVTTLAQVNIRNEHDRPIQVAIAYLAEDEEGNKKWISEGWFAVEPGTTALLKESVEVRYYYLYIVDNANNEWGGEGFQLMVDEVNEFTIKKADKTYASETNKTYKMHNFMEIDTGEKVKEFTYLFKGKNDVETPKETSK